MLPKINPVQTAAWKELEKHFFEIKSFHLRELFERDPDRFSKLSLRTPELLLDYSKNRITPKTMELLVQLARECELPAAIEAMFTGKRINVTENRAVLHVTLRNFKDASFMLDGKDILQDIRRVLAQMKQFCTAIHSGSWKGYSGKPINTIVNIGIGGSDLGPYMVTEALKPYWINGWQTYFVSNVDGTHIAETLKRINPEQTLFLIASKTFTTQETMTNAFTARQWFLEKTNNPEAIARHFAALSTNEQEVTKFGIDPACRFEFWDWV
ncbi:MAG: glucose-6-phosphate isomerase, partial [Chitinophagaceae bacterium]